MAIAGLRPIPKASRPSGGLDRSLPVLIVQVGDHPLQYGMLGAVRSLGRLGIPVYAVAPAGSALVRSRYLAGAFGWTVSPSDDDRQILSDLLGFAATIGARAVALAGDDEAATLLAERRAELSAAYLMPAVDSSLPRRLTSKFEMAQLCHAAGVPTPRTERPSSPRELLALAEQIGYPVVLKNDAAWTRISHPGVRNTVLVRARIGLEELASSWSSMPRVIVQPYLRDTGTNDWVVNGYLPDDGSDGILFTGRKARSWPPYTGVASCAYTALNPQLAETTEALCHAIGYRGIFDVDWRVDPSDGTLKLVDFNPRLGAMFRLFVRADGLDVVRAMHLDLTERELPTSGPMGNRTFFVENLDLPARLAYRRNGDRVPTPPGQVELAWWARDDPAPAAAAALASLKLALTGVRHGTLGRSGLA